MNYHFNLQEVDNQQDTVLSFSKDSIKQSSNVNFLNNNSQIIDNERYIYVRLIQDAYDATSYYYVNSQENAPIADYFLNASYFPIDKQTASSVVEREETVHAQSQNFSFQHTDILLLLLIVLSSLIAFVRFTTHYYIKNITASVFSFAYSRTLFHERTKLLFIKDFILEFVFFISSGVLAAHLAVYFHFLRQNELSLAHYFLFSFTIFVFITSYRIFIRLLGFFTYTSSMAAEYLYYFGNSLKFLGIFNVIVLFALLFSAQNIQVYTVLFIFFIYLTLYLIRVYKIFFDFLTNRFPLFYFILYFCALEIVPIIMLIKEIFLI